VKALKGRDSRFAMAISPLQGFTFFWWVTQGCASLALGFTIPPRCGEEISGHFRNSTIRV